jgi:hypothetical protein
MGGGLYNYEASPTIQNNTFTGNSADSGGGLYNENGNPTVLTNTYTSNSASFGGGVYTESGSPIIRNNTIKNNSADDGGGLLNGSSNSTIQSNTFTNNLANSRGGGLFNRSGNLIIQNNIFTGNSAYEGGGLYHWIGDSTIQNNTIIGNSAYSGGGLQINNFWESPSIRSNIVVNNTASWIGGGICNLGKITTLDYNDVWNNTGGDYSGISPGAHDISADPLLTDSANGDIHLVAGSSCINAGDPVNYPPADFEGDPRPYGTAPDIGADEFTGSP